MVVVMVLVVGIVGMGRVAEIVRGVGLSGAIKALFLLSSYWLSFWEEDIIGRLGGEDCFLCILSSFRRVLMWCTILLGGSGRRCCLLMFL